MVQRSQEAKLEGNGALKFVIFKQELSEVNQAFYVSKNGSIQLVTTQLKNFQASHETNL